MSRALVGLVSAAWIAAPFLARADETYQLCGAAATGFIKMGKQLVCMRGSNAAPPSSSPPKRNPKDPWIPEGFEKYNGVIAYRLMGAAGCKIGGDTCRPIEIVTKTGCKSLYVSASQLDEQGKNIGFTNDSTVGVAAGQIARMELRQKGRLDVAEINCY